MSRLAFRSTISLMESIPPLVIPENVNIHEVIEMFRGEMARMWRSSVTPSTVSTEQVEPRAGATREYIIRNVRRLHATANIDDLFVTTPLNRMRRGEDE